MAKYSVKMVSKTKVHKETSPTLHEPVYIVQFEVPEEGYTDSVEIKEKDFSMTKVKEAIKQKLVKYEETSFTPVVFEVEIK